VQVQATLSASCSFQRLVQKQLGPITLVLFSLAVYGGSTVIKFAFRARKPWREKKCSTWQRRKEEEEEEEEVETTAKERGENRRGRRRKV
jgi:hypothetical protein